MHHDRAAPARLRLRTAWALCLAALLVLLVLPGCGSAPRTETPAAAARASSLTAERQWLQAWFQDTPVQIDQPGDDSMRIEVPREFSFDPGRSQVKPPLAAVLDKLAQSLRRLPEARLQQVAAPGDGSGGPALARQRAEQVRAHLRSRGVPAVQLGPATATTAMAVQLRIAVPPP
ncbi:MAG: hypothetical protein JSS18_07075 [Proteobacteria bacterium]|nr:hypothetical protein [Pseudomonadota bacterium]